LDDLVLGVTPANTCPPWQLEQPLVMPTWFITAPKKLVNCVVEWQVSQLKVVGRWLIGFDTGMTPANT